MKLHRGAKDLFEFLRVRSPGDVVTRDELCRACSWQSSTLKTYISKNMVTPFMIELPDGDLRLIRGGAGVTEEEVNDAFSQKKRAALTLGRNDELRGVRDSFKLDRFLGRGAVGQVWSAKRQSNGASVAVKIVDPREDLIAQSVFANVLERFAREAKNGLEIHHDAIVSVLDSGVFRSRPFIAMERAEGTVAERVRATSGLPWLEAAAIVRRVLAGLAALHGYDCVHRDVKPENMLQFPRGVVLGDLGIVRWSDLNPAFTGAATITRASIQLGSWYYMAPEQKRSPHDATPASDIYALGVSWYELMTSTTPPAEAFVAHDVAPPAAPSWVHDTIMAMTSYRADSRPSVDELLRLLASV